MKFNDDDLQSWEGKMKVVAHLSSLSDISPCSQHAPFSIMFPSFLLYSHSHSFTIPSSNYYLPKSDTITFFS